MTYCSFSMSIQGESHKQKNIVMQDYSAHENSNITLAVLSDGHGNKNSFRSDKGARMAVHVCMDGMKEYACKYMYINGELDKNPKLEKQALRQLCKGIVAKWNLMIEEDLKQNPVSLEELTLCDEKWLNLYRTKKRENHMYGATLIGVMQYEDRLLVLQQGDGKCIFLSEGGKFYQPVALDERCFSNITTSMCDDDAAQSMRIYSQLLNEQEKVAAVFLASDGVEDSYRNDNIMYNFYRRLCLDILKHGIEDTCCHYMSEELEQLSKNGSGDDISVAGIIDIDIIEKLTQNFRLDIEREIKTETAKNALEHMNSMETKRRYLSSQMKEKEKQKSLLEQKLNENIKLEEELNDKIIELKMLKDTFLHKYIKVRREVQHRSLLENTLNVLVSFQDTQRQNVLQKLKIKEHQLKNIETELNEVHLQLANVLEEQGKLKEQYELNSLEFEKAHDEYQSYEKVYLNYQNEYENAIK